MEMLPSDAPVHMVIGVGGEGEEEEEEKEVERGEGERGEVERGGGEGEGEEEGVLSRFDFLFLGSPNKAVTRFRSCAP